MRFYLPPILTSKKIYINKKKNKSKNKNKKQKKTKKPPTMSVKSFCLLNSLIDEVKKIPL